MGSSVETEFNACLQRGKISRFADGPKLVRKELRIARSDLRTAKAGLKQQQWKWSTIQAYFALFHTARALLYSEGYREKSHYCLRVGIDALFVTTGKISGQFVDALQAGKVMREDADYGDHFSETGAKKLVNTAAGFIRAAECLFK
jgi:uncharacterized protein (UPF0332 family)